LIEWTISRVATSVVVLIICLSVMGLFGMEAASVRQMELKGLAGTVSDLVVDVDTLGCAASFEVNWTVSSESFGLPRAFHGDTYTIQFTSERPYLVWHGERVAGHPFSSEVRLLDATGGPVSMLEVRSATGFVLSSEAEWESWGLDYPVYISPLG
jgi:fermentation-respiration switch protein FrsA (DUF1100 family)